MSSSLCSYLSNGLGEIERRRTQSLSRQDPEAFFSACEEGGFSGEEDAALYQQGYELAEIRQGKENLRESRLAKMEEEATKRHSLELSKLKKRQDKLRASNFDYESFRKAAEEKGYDLGDHLSNTYNKARILERHGLNVVRDRGRIVPTHEARQCVIGAVFESRYKSSLIL